MPRRRTRAAWTSCARLERHYRRHAGHRVHRRGGPALHAADAQRQAPRAGRRAFRRRRGRRGPAHARRGDLDDRRRRARRAAAPDLRPLRATTRCSHAASPPRRAPRRATIVFTAQEAVAAARGRPASRSSCARSPRPTTSPASTPPRDPHPRGRQGSHAALVARGMGRPAVTGAAAVEIDVAAGEVRDRRARAPRAATASRSTGRPGPVTTDDVPLVEPHGRRPSSRRCSRWCDELRDDRRPRKRRHARGRAPRDRARRRGHRPVPDRAHVHGGDRQPKMAR